MTTPAIRTALERLIGLEDAASTNGADPDTTVWDDAVAAGRAALNAEPERPTMAEEALVALERIQHGDASHGSDDFDLVANALGQLRRWGTPPTPEPPAEALAARPLLEQVAAMADCIGAKTVGQITEISNRAAAWLRQNPPGQPVTIEPRGCPTPGACSCVEPAPPAPQAGEMPSDELMGQWKEECKRLSLESDYAIPASSFMAQRVVAWARQQQATELAALQGVPVAGVSDEHRDAVCTAIAESLGNAYDCQRVWSAWSYGTMGPDDFTLTAEDGDRVAEIADAAIEVIGNFAMQTEVTVCEQLRIVKAGIRAGYNLGHHHTVEGGWGDPDEVADDIAQETLDEMGLPPVPQCLIARMAAELDRLQPLPAFPPDTPHPLAAEARAWLQQLADVPAPQAGEAQP